MDTDPFHYDAWIEEALRNVIRRSLAYASENGLPGDHHFYLTFRTDNEAKGIDISSSLRAEHPKEMTIVLQHEFDEMIVNEDAVWVTLQFNGKPERLRIPFDAMISFADPSVNFGLQLKVTNKVEEEITHSEAHNADTTIDGKTGYDAKTTKGLGEVIALDAFRKK
jgi:hypothetical protein|tara:strand:+ start:40 stop:537 length:498 start_codon:yes stop_codon:yes gene_type:complete